MGAALGLVLVLWVALVTVEPDPAAEHDLQTGAPVVSEPADPVARTFALPEIPVVEQPGELKAAISVQPTPVEPTGQTGTAFGVSDIPHVQREGNTVRSWVPNEYFEQKYEDASREELLDAKATAVVLHGKFTQEAFTHYLASGGGESKVTDWSSKPVDLNAEPPPREPSQGLISMSRTEPYGEDGSLALRQKGRLPWAEYVAVYDNVDELSWLNRELRRRDKARQAEALAQLEAAGK